MDRQVCPHCPKYYHIYFFSPVRRPTHKLYVSSCNHALAIGFFDKRCLFFGVRKKKMGKWAVHPKHVSSCFYYYYFLVWFCVFIFKENKGKYFVPHFLFCFQESNMKTYTHTKKRLLVNIVSHDFIYPNVNDIFYDSVYSSSLTDYTFIYIRYIYILFSCRRMSIKLFTGRGKVANISLPSRSLNKFARFFEGSLLFHGRVVLV